MTIRSLAGCVLAVILCGCLQSNLHQTSCDFDKTDKQNGLTGPQPHAELPPVLAEQITRENAHNAATALEAELRAAQR